MSNSPPTSGVHPFTFFGVTFVLSWAIWVPLLLSHWGIGPLHVDEGTSSIVRLLGVLMPSVAALLLTVIADGRAGLSRLLGRLAIWRVGWGWWMAAVLVQPLLLMVTALVYNVLGGFPAIAVSSEFSPAALIAQTLMLGIAALGEEIGWRGVALPQLQARLSVSLASAILAVLWATWHVPFWLLLDTIPQFGIGYLVVDYVFILAGNFYITWFFNHSRGSLLLPVAFHLAFNIVNVAILPVTSSTGAFVTFTVLDWLITLAIMPHLQPNIDEPRGDTSNVMASLPRSIQ